MLRRTFALLAVAALAATWAAPAFAVDEPEVMKGKVQKVDGDKLIVVNNTDNKEYTFAVPATAKVTCDGKNCKLADLKGGSKVKVTTQKKDKGVAVVSVEGSEK
jgi:hypothetical protein